MSGGAFDYKQHFIEYMADEIEQRILNSGRKIPQDALLRYKIIDRCLRNRYRRWTIEDLVDEVSEALYDMEGIRKGISLRTVQNDIQIMRSDKLGYNAPIEVYDQKYYRYADQNYSITELPLTAEDFNLITKAVKMLETTGDKPEFQQMGRILARVKKRLTAILNYG